jgi:hypothetical protein
VLGSRSLAEAERAQTREWLRDEEHGLFFSQPHFDQRHGLESALFVAKQAPGRTDLIRAAMLHDVGKRHARLGPVGRSLASAWSKLGRRPGGRWGNYLDHGRIGAEDLLTAEAEPLVVAFARTHHGDRPDDISLGDWDLLQRADRVRRQTPDAGRQ